MNERLGSLCRRLGAEEAGADLTPLTLDWLAEMGVFAVADAEDVAARMPEESEFDTDDGGRHPTV